MSQLETHELKSLTICWRDQEIPLHFRTAFIFIDSTDFELGWFIDTNDLNNQPLLEALNQSSDIKIKLTAQTLDDVTVSGTGYIHPNLRAMCASIKGEGELFGYQDLKKPPQELF